MPSSRRRPYRQEPDEEPSRRGSSRQRRRGVSSRERRELFSEPPEHVEGDQLDSIGLDEGGRRRKSRRRVSDRAKQSISERGSQRTVTVAKSKREKQERARRRLKNLVPVAVLAGVAALGGIACLIPGWIRSYHLGRLESSSALIRETAAINLGKSGSGLEALLAKMRTGKFDGAGGAAALALGTCVTEGKSAEAALEKLKTASEGKEPDTRASAAFGLGLTRSPDAVETLAKLLAGDPENIVRIQAARGLGMIGSPESVAALVTQAETGAEVRESVIGAVLTAACPQARDQLVAGLGAATEEMRRACALALLTLEPAYWPGDADLKKLFESPKPAVRAGAVEFLALKGGGVFDEIIPKALADESELVRAAGVEAAGLRGWKKAAADIEKLLASEEEKSKVKEAAARALQGMRRLESTVPLAKSLVNNNQDEKSRLAAAKALSAISRWHTPMRLSAKGEYNDYPTHLKLAVKTPDPRWEALGLLADACGSFPESVAPPAFKAMRDLAWRKVAPKADVWKSWMDNKREEAKTLGQISHLMSKAEAEGKKGRDHHEEAYKLRKQARKLSKELLDQCDPEDKDFFENLDRDLWGLLGEGKYPGDEKKDEAKKKEAKAKEK